MRLSVADEKLKAVIEEAISRKKTREVLEKLGIDLDEVAQKLGVNLGVDDEKLQERIRERLGEVENFKIVARHNNLAYAVWESNFKDQRGNEERRIVIATLSVRSGAPLRLVSLPASVVPEIAKELGGRVG